MSAQIETKADKSPSRARQARKRTKKSTDAEMHEAMKRTEPSLRPDLFLAGYYD